MAVNLIDDDDLDDGMLDDDEVVCFMSQMANQGRADRLASF